jgi:hypothetical protein
MKKNTNSKKNNAVANTAAAATTIRVTAFAAIGCFVSLTTPPASNDKPYWTVVVQNDKAVYSPRYRLHSAEKAQELARKIADERGIAVVTKAAPERPDLRTDAQKAAFAAEQAAAEARLAKQNQTPA